MSTKDVPAGAADLVRMLEGRLNAERLERRRLEALLAGMHARPAPDDGHAASERLERLIAERTHALSLARDEAVAASHSKSSFLANMSHEIRTPLTSIIGFAELLQDPAVDIAEKGDAAKTIVRNGRHLLEVINDILDMSKIESNQLALEWLDVGLPRLLSDIEALAAGRAREKSLRFTVRHHLPLPPRLRTDTVRIKQILLNFCSNAIKFSERGDVRLDVRHDAASARLTFSVSDTGIGMTEAEMSRLFKPFSQADLSTTRKFGGTGLGLYISRQLADMLGGRIEVASRPGEGSCFTLHVPLGIDCAAAEMLTSARDFDDFRRPVFQITAVEVPALSGRVLVAEDGPDNQRLLASYLRQAGVDFEIVGNGSLAVERARAEDFALVLMDIQMPVMDGVSATRRLRESRYAGPIVALTANVMQSDVALYRASGFDDVLAKPIDRNRFYDVLQRFVPEAEAPPTLISIALDPVETAYERELAALTAEFAAGLPKAFAEIEGAARAGDGLLLRALLHTLRGTAGSYGFTGVSARAGEIERLLEMDEPAAAAALCRRLADSR